MTVETHLLTASWLVINYCRRRVNTQSEEEEEEVELSAFLYLKKNRAKVSWVCYTKQTSRRGRTFCWPKFWHEFESEMEVRGSSRRRKRKKRNCRDSFDDFSWRRKKITASPPPLGVSLYTCLGISNGRNWKKKKVWGGGNIQCCSCMCTSNPPWNSPVDEPQLGSVVGSGGPIFTEKGGRVCFVDWCGGRTTMCTYVALWAYLM